ncbi:MAG: NAD-dependent deacylase [Bacteroidetes bacterium]|nr:NAD-dependent deacylase [Bacteroidota bacterium]
MKKNEKVVVFSGAGMSAESGIKTFRDSDGLWEQHRVEDVATPEAWQRSPSLVLRFYNERLRQAKEAQPNQGHLVIARLQKMFELQVITQNVDDLHERAGSKNVLHLHGELKKMRSSIDEKLIFPVENNEIQLGHLCPRGSQLRPHIVWFGESVPLMEQAIDMVSEATLLIIVGTSLVVYPAANLIHYTTPSCKKYLIDPASFDASTLHGITHIKKKASDGLLEMEKMMEASFYTH